MRPRVPILRGACAAVLATGGGVLAAVAVAGGSNMIGAATAASHAPRARHHRRTATPRFNNTSYLVRAGRRFRVLVKPHSAWRRPSTCRLAVSRGGDTRVYRIRGVVSDFLVTLPTSRRAQQGIWHLSVGCRARGAAESRLASASVLVASSRRAHGGLLGKRQRIDVQPLQAHARIINGKYGVGGAPPNPGFPNGQCTFWAYEQRSDIYWTSVDNGAPKYGWNADMWSVYAAKYGHFPEGTTPAVGAIMVQPASWHSSVGHVAYVTQVIDSQHWVTTEMNTDGAGTPNKVFTVHDTSIQYRGEYDYRVGGAIYRHVLPGTVFIYQMSSPSGGASSSPVTSSPPQTITVTQTTTVTNTVTQPSGGSGGSSNGGGSNGGGSNSNGGGSTGGGSTGGGSTPPPPPTTWNETAGGVAHTWTNYADAGGSEGPSIGGGQTVQIACKVQGFRVADGNTWWYRIAQAPWNGGYYVSADAFYNDGATSGSLAGTPFVDPAVANC